MDQEIVGVHGVRLGRLDRVEDSREEGVEAAGTARPLHDREGVEAAVAVGEAGAGSDERGVHASILRARADSS